MKVRDHPPRNSLGAGVADTTRDNMMTNKTSKAKRITGEVAKEEVNHIKMIIMAKITIMDRSHRNTRKAIKIKDSSNLRKPYMKNDLPKDCNLKCFPNKTAG